MRSIYQAASTVDAQRLVDLRANEGTEAHVQGNYLAGAIGELPAGGMIRAWVHDDVERARRSYERGNRPLRRSAWGATQSRPQRSFV